MVNRQRPFSLTDLDRFARDVPHNAFRQLRRFAPVYWNPAPTPVDPTHGFWLVTRHADIVFIEKNPLLFSSHYGLTLADAPPSNASPAWSMVRDGLTHLDPPEHAQHRQIAASWFAPRAVAARESAIRIIAEEVLERACARERFDFASEVALRFPVSVVLGEVLGLPAEDFTRVIHWSDVIAAPADPEFPRSAGTDTVHEIHAYAFSLFEARRRWPGTDVLSLLAHSPSPAGGPMTKEIFVRYFWSLLTGAFDTTASAISGGMLALIEYPDQYERLLQDPSLLTSAVEEILRWETPTIYFRRTAMADTVLRGQIIRRGQPVVMCYASANRDEEEFPDPDVFEIGRRPNNHLAFGHGPHFCLGANLARAEIRIMFEQIIRRNLRLKLCGGIRRARSNFQNRIKEMPVSIVSPEVTATWQSSFSE